MADDPYVVLGVPRGASDEEIRRAFRRLAKDSHPDLHPGDAAAADRFKKLSVAHDVIGDPEVRRKYDRGEVDGTGEPRRAYHRSSSSNHTSHAGGHAAGGRTRGAEEFAFGDIFSDLFGPGFGNGRSYSRMRGRDIRFTLEVDFLDAINSAKRRVSLAEGRTLDVAIPAGVESGQVLRLKNQGGAGVQGGPAGDALVELTVRPHAFFRREGQDVHMDLNISLTEAVEGGRIQAPTPTGPVTLTIPAGSNTGKTLRLKGKGVAGQGDQFVKLLVMLPEAPDEDLKKFVKKWPKRDYVPPRPQG